MVYLFSFFYFPLYRWFFYLLYLLFVTNQLVAFVEEARFERAYQIGSTFLRLPHRVLTVTPFPHYFK